jgi:pleiotropic regulator 1
MSTTTLPSLSTLYTQNAKRTRTVFDGGLDDGWRDEERRYVPFLMKDLQHLTCSPFANLYSTRLRLSVKLNDEYKDFKTLPAALLAQQGAVGPAKPGGPQKERKMITAGGGPFPNPRSNEY